MNHKLARTPDEILEERISDAHWELTVCLLVEPDKSACRPVQDKFYELLRMRSPGQISRMEEAMEMKR